MLAAALAVACGGETDPTKLKIPGEGIAAIDTAMLMRHIRVLADDSLQGRAPGTIGEELPANYAKAEFQLQHGFVDVFRYINGYGTLDASWRQAWSQMPGYRLDHIFASLTLQPTGCRYLHQLRDAGLSDHSPIEAVFSVDGGSLQVPGTEPLELA